MDKPCFDACDAGKPARCNDGAKSNCLHVCGDSKFGHKGGGTWEDCQYGALASCSQFSLTRFVGLQAREAGLKKARDTWKELAQKRERERDEALKALKPFAKAGVTMDRDHNILFVIYEDGAGAAEKFFETARKVVEELRR